MQELFLLCAFIFNVLRSLSKRLLWAVAVMLFPVVLLFASLFIWAGAGVAVWSLGVWAGVWAPVAVAVGFRVGRGELRRVLKSPEPWAGSGLVPWTGLFMPGLTLPGIRLFLPSPCRRWLSGGCSARFLKLGCGLRFSRPALRACSAFAAARCCRAAQV